MTVHPRFQYPNGLPPGEYSDNEPNREYGPRPRSFQRRWERHSGSTHRTPGRGGNVLNSQSFYVAIQPPPLDIMSPWKAHQEPHTLISESLALTSGFWIPRSTEINNTARQLVVPWILSIDRLKDLIQTDEAQTTVYTAHKDTERIDHLNKSSTKEIKEVEGQHRRYTARSKKRPTSPPQTSDPKSQLATEQSGSSSLEFFPRQGERRLKFSDAASRVSESTIDKSHNWKSTSSVTARSIISAPTIMERDTSGLRRRSGRDELETAKMKPIEIEQSSPSEISEDEHGRNDVEEGSNTLVDYDTTNDDRRSRFTETQLLEDSPPWENFRKKDQSDSSNFHAKNVQLRLVDRKDLPESRTASLPGLTREVEKHEFFISLAIPGPSKYTLTRLTFDQIDCTDADIAREIATAYYAVRGTAHKMSLKGVSSFQIVQFELESVTHTKRLLEGIRGSGGSNFRTFLQLQALANGFYSPQPLKQNYYWVNFFRQYRKTIDVRQVLPDGSIVDTNVVELSDEDFDPVGLVIETSWMKKRVLVAAFLPVALGILIGVIWSLKSGVEAGFAIASYVLASVSLLLAAYAFACSDVAPKSWSFWQDSPY